MNTREKLKMIKAENEKFNQFAFKNPEVADKIRKYGREARKHFTTKEAMAFNEFLFKSCKEYYALCAAQNVVKNFDDFVNSDNPFKGPVFEFMDEASSLYSLFQNWNQNKIVYTYTAEMASDLIENAGDLEERSIPVDALKHLPYRMFFLGIDIIRECDNDEFIGYFVHTDDDKVVISLVMDTLDPNSKSSFNLSETCVTLHFNENITVNDLYREIEDSSSERRKDCEDVYHKLGVNIDDRRRKEHIQEEYEIHRNNSTVIVKMLPLFLYLATEKPDIKEFANPADKKKPVGKPVKGNKPAEKTTRYSVGEEFTIKYRKFQQTCAEYERIKGESAEVALRKMPPHTRKAHWHHHWVGSDLNPEKNGPRRLRLDWQEATFVHLELKDLLCPTVIEIEKDEEESAQQTQQTEELDDYEYEME